MPSYEISYIRQLSGSPVSGLVGLVQLTFTPLGRSSSAGLHQNSTSGNMKLLDCGIFVLILDRLLMRITDQYLPCSKHPYKLHQANNTKLILPKLPNPSQHLICPTTLHTLFSLSVFSVRLVCALLVVAHDCPLLLLFSLLYCIEPHYTVLDSQQIFLNNIYYSTQPWFKLYY